MTLRIMAITALALTVSGCVSGIDPTLSTGSVKPVGPALIADVAPEYAAAYLPQNAGGIEAVRQTSKPDQVFQTILYPNPGYGAGENSLSVSIAPPSAGKSFYQAPTTREIKAEMRAALPGTAMAISAAPGENMQGPFGYAIGRASGGDSCIFAWQIAENVSRTEQTGFGKLSSRRYAAKVRLRYCHPSLSEAALVSLMSGLKVREMTAPTLEMLRFAEGSGVPARAVNVSAPEPVRAAAKPVKTVAKAVRKPVVKAVEKPVGKAAKVLKPSELQATASVRRETPASDPEDSSGSTVKRKPLTVPLPGSS